MGIEHEFFAGATGKGKTYLAVYKYQRDMGISIFFNTQHDLKVMKASDVVVTNLKDFARELEKKTRRICYNPSMNDDKAMQEAEIIIDLLFKMGKIVCETREVHWATLTLDEVHDLSSNRQTNKRIDKLFKRGRRWGIKGRAISQRPADTSHGILTQCQRHYIYEINLYETPYFTKYKFPVEELDGWIKRDYHFVRFDGFTFEKMNPVSIEKGG